MSATKRFIAERVLTWKGKRLTVRLAAPVRLKSSEDWQCQYEFKLAGNRRKNCSETIFGVDAFQAITIALQGIELEIAKRFPGAYLHTRDFGHGFSHVRHHSGLPRKYEMRIVKHLRREEDRLYGESVQEIIRLRRKAKQKSSGRKGDTPA